MQNLTITSKAGLSVELADLGARLLSVHLTTDTEPLSVLRGYQNCQQYMNDSFYMGASIGPIANRIRDARFLLGEQEVRLPANQNGHCLHSADLGIAQQTWRVAEQSTSSVSFELNTQAVAGSLPGNLNLRASYAVKGRALEVEYRASSDAETYLNISNHAYWNLNRDKSAIRDHEFELFAHAYADKDEEDIPNGNVTQLEPPFQYSLESTTVPPELRHKVDHHFIVDEYSDELKVMAKATSPQTGVSLVVSSTKPGFQLYSGHFLSDPLEPFAGFCVEPQYVPDAINRPEFIAPLLTPQKPYRHLIRYEFLGGN